MKLVTTALLSSLAFVLVALPLRLSAEPAPQRDTATLLFDNPDWSKAPAGTKLTYSYARKTFGAAEFGQSFDDTITLTLQAGDDAKSRKVDVVMFSGPHRHAAGPFDNVSTNPVLLLMFEDHLQELAQIFHANPRYLKNAIRKAWRESAKIEDVTLTVDGKPTPGTRITIEPFLDDKMSYSMKGLDKLIYTVDIADSVPGEIADIDIHTPAASEKKYSETLHYEMGKTP